MSPHEFMFTEQSWCEQTGGCGGLCLCNRSSSIMWLRRAPHPPPSEKSDTRHQSRNMQLGAWAAPLSSFLPLSLSSSYQTLVVGGGRAVRKAAWEWWQSHLICSCFSQFLSGAYPTPGESVSRASFTKAGLQWSDWDERPWGGCQQLPSARVLPLPHSSKTTNRMSITSFKHCHHITMCFVVINYYRVGV